MRIILYDPVQVVECPMTVISISGALPRRHRKLPKRFLYLFLIIDNNKKFYYKDSAVVLCSSPELLLTVQMIN